MGLWTKTIDRARTGDGRLESLNRYVLNQICEYIDGIRVHYDHMLKPDSYGYKCMYKIKNRFVNFRIFGINISLYVPEGKDNIWWIMLHIMDKLYPFRNHKSGIKILYDVIRTNEMRMSKWNDEDFLAYPIL